MCCTIPLITGGGKRDQETGAGANTGIEKSSTVKTRGGTKEGRGEGTGEERKSLLKSQSQTFYKCTKTFFPHLPRGEYINIYTASWGRYPKIQALPPSPESSLPTSPLRIKNTPSLFLAQQESWKQDRNPDVFRGRKRRPLQKSGTTAKGPLGTCTPGLFPQMHPVIPTPKVEVLLGDDSSTSLAQAIVTKKATFLSPQT